MPGTTEVPDIELVIEDIGGGGGKPPEGGDDGDGGDDDKRRRKGSPSPNRYSTAIAIALVSILMFFMALASALSFCGAAAMRGWLCICRRFSGLIP